MYDIGDLVRLSASFASAASVLTDPSGVWLTVKAPTGSSLYVGVSASLIKSSTGIYYSDYSVAEAGQHYYVWSGSGTIQSVQEGAFTVARAASPVLTAYAETMDVAMYCSNLINGVADFSSTTTPTIANVVAWLNRGAAIINNRIKAAGYTLSVGYATDVWRELAELNAFYAVARAEMARTNVRLAVGERTRGQVFEEMFWKGLDKFIAQDLTQIGAGYIHGGYIGGTSISEKLSVESDSDRVAPRFIRGQFDNNG